jgi:hypothetical protein
LPPGDCAEPVDLSDQPDISGPSAGLHAEPLDHRPAIVKPRIIDPLTVREALQYLDADFLRERAFDPAHAIPKPNDFPLFLDVHWPPPKE